MFYISFQLEGTGRLFPRKILKPVNHPKKGGCSGAKYVALIKTSYAEYGRRTMIRNMFKSQLEDGEYDLFFLVGFRKNRFWKEPILTSQELVNKDKVLMKEFQSFNDLGKISYKVLRV